MLFFQLGNLSCYAFQLHLQVVQCGLLWGEVAGDDERYRRQLKAAAAPLIAKWELILGVKVERFFVQRMKTRWGSSNPRLGAIRLNTELAKKSPECLEYIVVHEKAHLLEPTHNARFAAQLDKSLPNWQLLRAELNRAPLGHVTWDY